MEALNIWVVKLRHLFRWRSLVKERPLSNSRAKLAVQRRSRHTYASRFCPRRAAPHCMVVNLVRSGRKQPQLFSASAGGSARHPYSNWSAGESSGCLSKPLIRMIKQNAISAAVLLAALSLSAPALAVDSFAVQG